MILFKSLTLTTYTRHWYCGQNISLYQISVGSSGIVILYHNGPIHFSGNIFIQTVPLMTELPDPLAVGLCAGNLAIIC
jgi:hypothetical protein